MRDEPAPKASRKRKNGGSNDNSATREGRLPQQQEGAASPAKRPKLQKLSASAMNQSSTPERIPKSYTVQPSNTPLPLETVGHREGQHGGTARYPRPSQDSELAHEDPDPEETPKPRSLSMRPDLISSDRRSLAASDSTESSLSTDITGSGSRKRKRTRDGSPKKPTRLAEFLLSDTPVAFKAFDTLNYPTPTEMKSLRKDMAAIGAGRHIIPKALEEIASGTLENIYPENFAADEAAQAGDELPEHLSHEAFLGEILKIVAAARECFNAKLPECSWNSEVHSKLLRSALTGTWESKGVWYRDVTPAKITNPSLLPKSAKGSVLQSKMVDYALIMNPLAEGRLHDQIVARLNADQKLARTSVERKCSINHTDAEYLWFSPIAVSIETKRGAVDEDNMRVQLALWVSAHFAKLKELSPTAKPPPLPLLSIQGHYWKLMIAFVKGNGGIVILADLALGDTFTAKGTYQVVAAVRRLAMWVDEEYRPWYQKAILEFEPKPKYT